MKQISQIKFPHIFEINKLKQDLAICLNRDWCMHYQTSDFEGTWKIIALRSVGGFENNIYSQPSSVYTDTQLLKECKYFQEVISQFKCEIQSVRLMQLGVGSEIKEHEDYNLNYEKGYFRIHLPIQTNPGVEFIVDNQLIPMREGECWYANLGLPHKVINRGKISRIHLVIDCIRNEWSDQLFGENGYKFELEGKSGVAVKDEDIPHIVEALRKIGTEAALAQIERLLKFI